MSMTQEQTILSYLQEGNTLTSMAAFNLFGITKLAARVSDLRKKAEGKKILRDDSHAVASTGAEVLDGCH